MTFTTARSGFRNRQLAEIVGGVLERTTDSNHASYDLRRLLGKGYRERATHSHAHHLASKVLAGDSSSSRLMAVSSAQGSRLLNQALPPEFVRARASDDFSIISGAGANLSHLG